MTDRAYIISRTLENKIAIAENNDQNTLWVTLDVLKEILAMLKEQEAMVKPTKCPCGELFDAKDSSFCPRCGCAYGELSGRYTNIGR